MEPPQYGVSARERAALLQQAQERAVRRQQFLKLVSDPHRHGTGEGGYVFDPAVQRFSAMKATQYDHFKATPRTVRGGLWVLVFPMVALGYAVHYERSTKENKFRTGQVSYRDRRFKLI